MSDQETPSILIIGGTTEGRIAVQVCDEAAKPFFYSTKGEGQQVESANGIRVSGGLDHNSMPLFCRDNNVQLLIDAAHPFAVNVHRTVGETAAMLSLPIVRLERHFPDPDPRLLFFDTYPDAMSYMEEQGYDRLLALTGVNTIARLRPFWSAHECHFRIMNRPESLETVARNAFPMDHILFYDDGEPDEQLFGRLRPDAIITKESGESGGFVEKTSVALSMGIPVLVIRRPSLPYTASATVYGKYGLRKSVERLLPDFFHLKTGYTTGSTATAAATAAMTALLTGEVLSEVTISLPNDEPALLPVERVVVESDGSVTATAIKHSGDDPDVTNGLEICANVRWSTAHDEVRFLQGQGVGRVTLPGLGLEIGGPAINVTPRKMMTREVERLLHLWGEDERGVDIRISVPQGEEIATRTFNPKLGITGGISIIGTSGVVKPFSSEAFVRSIRREIQVAKALGIRRLIINSGAKSERYLKALFPEAVPQAFVQYGNFIGETITAADEEGIPEVHLSVMLGKAVKLAEGKLDTHSKKAVMNKAFLKQVAGDVGCPEEIIRQIDDITMARELWSLIPTECRTFFYRIQSLCHEVCAPLLPHGVLTVMLMDDEGHIL